MRGLSTRVQDALMRERWPTFSTRGRSRDHVEWVGSLRPICQPYTVRVTLDRLGPQAGNWLPAVTVVDPVLRRRAQNADVPLPHVYDNAQCAALPFLCLYDPRANEWHGGLAVAKTIVPWAMEWLGCYEGWLLTGRWLGGGVH